MSKVIARKIAYGNVADFFDMKNAKSLFSISDFIDGLSKAKDRNHETRIIIEISFEYEDDNND